MSLYHCIGNLVSKRLYILNLGGTDLHSSSLILFASISEESLGLCYFQCQWEATVQPQFYPSPLTSISSLSFHFKF